MKTVLFTLGDMFDLRYADVGLAFVIKLSASAPDVKKLPVQCRTVRSWAEFCLWLVFSKACFVELSL